MSSRSWTVALHGADIVGQLTLRVLAGRGYLGMVVAAAQRGRGVGRKLIEATVAYAREHALQAIDLDVFEHNAAALELYRSCGFVPNGAPEECLRQTGERFKAIPMTLHLA